MKTLSKQFETILDELLDLDQVHPGQYGVLKKRLLAAVKERDAYVVTGNIVRKDQDEFVYIKGWNDRALLVVAKQE